MNSFIGSTTKYGLILFNFICLVFGLLCIIFGALARSSSNYGDVLAVGQGPANMSIIVGVSVFVICFLGCCGALKENRCMLITFGSIVFLLVIVEFAIGGFAYKYRNKLADVSVEQFQEKIKDIVKGKEPELKKNIDDLQMNLKCCGAVNATDWENHIPDSCYADQKHQELYTEGCVQAIKETLAPAMKVLAITVIAFACIQVLGILGSCCVASCIKRAQYDHV